MSDFEYTAAPSGRGNGRRWEWEGGPVSFDGSEGGEILDWTEKQARLKVSQGEVQGWPCGWEDCTEWASYAVEFHGQPGHVHDCEGHTAVLREWSDVASVIALPCPHVHTGETWTDRPRDLEA